ncbi:MAG: type II toxin-antitoxin system HicA family toxin [Spirochaetia bacterium]|nr:type II toxin-antitoxin system HicA family toxin [Spirochaetia bacterium]
MSRNSKLLKKILLGRSDNNIDFSELCGLLSFLGFDERIRSSHHIFTRNDIAEIINIQLAGSKAKAYQVKQIRNLILKYNLGEVDES